MNPKVSVIIPTYNRSAYLRYAVDSVLNQTHPVSEVIIVDDGSSDDTADVVQRHIKEIPAWRDRVRYFYESNQGQSAANNFGISKATGDWLAFNAHDDLWLPWKLEWQFRALARSGEQCGLCFTDAWFMNNPYMKRSIFQAASRPDAQAIGVVKDAARLVVEGRPPVWVQTVIVRTDLVQRVGGLDPVLRYSEDHDFMFRLALVTKFCFVSMPMVLIDRSPADNRHVGEARNWHRQEFCLGMDQYRFEKQLKLSKELDPATQHLIYRNLSEIHRAWANLYLDMGEFKKARSSMAEAAKYKSTPGLLVKRTAARMAPGWLRWFLQIRDRGYLRHDRVSWQADETFSMM